MTINVGTGIARILKQEGVEWVSTFPVCHVNNALGQEGIPMVMMRDDRYAVALADAFSRINAGSRIGVCTFQGGSTPRGCRSLTRAWPKPTRTALRSFASPTECPSGPPRTASSMSRPV
ncbi:MAG: hypothetical protein IIB29_11540 [Chloroflexi bacterium]|nr:hypothetical protein [Chloroflexota bacterium]